MSSNDSNWDSEEFRPERDAICNEEELELIEESKKAEEEKKEDGNDRVDILKEYLSDLRLIYILNQNWFRDFVWRLREDGHWL